MPYKIWKFDKDNYRVQNVATGEVEILQNFTLQSVKFCVDVNGYNAAKSANFKNTGRANDYFAWMEAEQVSVMKSSLLPKKVWYNPFKHLRFRDRTTLRVVDYATKVVINGNVLSYE